MEEENEVQGVLFEHKLELQPVIVQVVEYDQINRRIRLLHDYSMALMT